jgi:hypothetical protein
MGLLLQNPETVKEVITEMVPYFDAIMVGQNQTVDRAKKELDFRLDMIRKSQDTTRESLVHHGENFRMIGSCALKILGNDFKVDPFAAMLVEKHARYGDAPLRKWGEKGIIVRIDSKFERYKNITATNDKGGDEPAFETMQDILGYAILGYLMNRERPEGNFRPATPKSE